MMSANERQARNVWQDIEAEIIALELDIKTLKERKQVIGNYLITVNGSCEECQNSHWPHCDKENQDAS